MTEMFFRYQLQTTDVPAAQQFYAGLFGAQFWGSALSVSPLPERAAAAGAPAHWLGHIGTADVEGSAQRMVEFGGQRLGPTHAASDGSSWALLRDPFGAVVAVSAARTAPQPSRVAWHLHQSSDHAAAFAMYSALFGWTSRGALSLAPMPGTQQLFAWDAAGQTVGSMANTARLPHIHPQWLIFFAVADLPAALAQVRAAGGKALEPVQTASGDLFAPCDDVQGAAFGLYQALRPLE